MAVDVSYTVPAGGSVYAGRLPPGGLPVATLSGALGSITGNVTVAPAVAPFKVVRTGLRYTTLAQAVAGSISGDVIQVAPGTYVVSATGDSDPGMTVINGGDNNAINLPALTIEWEVPGTLPVIDMSAWFQRQGTTGGTNIAAISAGPGCLNLTVRGLHLIGHVAGDSYGINSNAGYLPGVGFNGNPAATLNIEYCKIQQFANGVKGTIYNFGLTLNISYSVLENCTGNGLTHGIYWPTSQALNALGCTFRTTVAGLQTSASSAGHLLKSRAKVTTVRGCFFDGAGGCASNIEAPGGGALTVVGNIMASYNVGDPSNPNIKYGFEEVARRITLSVSGTMPTVGQTISNGSATSTVYAVGANWIIYNNNTSTVYGVGNTISLVGGGVIGTVTASIGSPDGTAQDGRTHSVLVGQNTIVKEQGSSWPGTVGTAVGALWVHTGMTDDAGNPITLTPTVRNNLITNNAGSSTGAGARTLLDYPNNSAVARTSIDAAGVYSGAAIPGLPAVNDAPYAWAADFTVPAARTDTFRGGRITGLPAWFTAIPVGQWAALSSSTLSTSGVAQSQAGSTIAGYSGGIVNTVGIYSGSTFIPGTFLVVWGSGHTVGNNELYAFGPFESGTPQWYRPRDETTPYINNAAFDGNGNPVARHTYDAISYDATTNKMFTIGGLFGYTNSNSYPQCWTFDFNQVSPNVNQPWSYARAQVPGGLEAADTTAYDPTTRRIWWAGYGGSSIGYYDIAADTHTYQTFKNRLTSLYRTTSAIDSTRGIWAFKSSGLGFYRLNNGAANDWYAPTTTGTAPTDINTSILWDGYADEFVCWPSSGSTLYKLTPPATNPYAGGNAWVWSSVTPSGGATPTNGNANGTFKRFNIISFGGASRGYVVVNAHNEPVYFYRAG